MKTLFSILLAIYFTNISFSQTITTNPSLPTQNAAVTIKFNAIGTGLEGYTGDVYAHTGVTIDGVSWANVIGTWGNNTTQPKLTRIGTDLYELDVIPSINGFYNVGDGDVVTELCFVFRSSTGTPQTTDFFVDVFEEGLALAITQPEEEYIFVDANGSFDIQVAASFADQVEVYIDDVFNYSTTELSFIHNITAAASGTHEIKVIASDATSSVEDIRHYIVREVSVVEALPVGVIDGINYINSTTVTLVLHAPFKTSVYAIGDFNNWEINTAYLMKRTTSNASDPEMRYWITLSGLTSGQEYIFQYLVDEDIRIADPYTEKTSDPWMDHYIVNDVYPDLIEYPTGKTEGIASVFQTNQVSYNWQVNDFTSPKVEDLVVYELWVGNYTEAEDYQTLVDTIQYLVRLGVNAIELMPINEFEGNISWGYNPSFYFAPDKAYGTKNKLKEFIDVCHQNGIAVIMDIVLNHSYGQSPLVQLYLDKNTWKVTSENPWYNVDSPNTSYSWGYDFDHTSIYTQNFIDRVNEYWLTEYKFDGFRFDFTKGFTNTIGDGWAYDASRISILKRMYDKIISVNSDAYVILEHLTDNSEEKELSAYGLLLWGNMNEKYSEAAMGWTDNANSDLSWASYLSRTWTDKHLVTYMESHDEERLMYRTLHYGNYSSSYNTKEINTALARMELDALFFFTIPGPKMMWQFSELGYDYSIDYNGRTGKKPVKWDYYGVENRYRLYQTYSALINLKKEHDVFETSDFTIDIVGSHKSIHLNGSDMKVTVLGNFDVRYISINPNFQNTGKWYEYFSGDEIDVSNVNSTIDLAPGEYRLYTTVKLQTPDIVDDIENMNDNNIATENIKIFPNPASDFVNIEINSSKDLKNIFIDIYDISGKKLENVKVAEINSGNSKIRLNLIENNGRKLSPGIYYMSVYCVDFKQNMSFIVE
ncbi:MAG: T9SS type A sorting domain-containing protein [Bacteroidales bacterium]|nr:T9SS type A sorting domain-containing protein [Bacteroidales bacterium]